MTLSAPYQSVLDQWENQGIRVMQADMFNGICREIWWSQVIQRLQQKNSSFPFTSPRVFATNVSQQPFRDEVAWSVKGVKYLTPLSIPITPFFLSD